MKVGGEHSRNHLPRCHRLSRTDIDEAQSDVAGLVARPRRSFRQVLAFHASHFHAKTTRSPFMRG